MSRHFWEYAFYDFCLLLAVLLLISIIRSPR